MGVDNIQKVFRSLRSRIFLTPTIHYLSEPLLTATPASRRLRRHSSHSDVLIILNLKKIIIENLQSAWKRYRQPFVKLPWIQSVSLPDGKLSQPNTVMWCTKSYLSRSGVAPIKSYVSSVGNGIIRHIYEVNSDDRAAPGTISFVALTSEINMIEECLTRTSNENEPTFDLLSETVHVLRSDDAAAFILCCHWQFAGDLRRKLSYVWTHISNIMKLDMQIYKSRALLVAKLGMHLGEFKCIIIEKYLLQWVLMPVKSVPNE
jgi:hypothetical protein